MEDFRNDLLNRNEVALLAKHNGNPGFQNALKMISEHFKAKEDVIAIKSVEGSFGKDDFLIKAFIYDSLKDKEKIEPKKKIKKEKKT